MYSKGFWIIFASCGQIGSKVVWGKCALGSQFWSVSGLQEPKGPLTSGNIYLQLKVVQVYWNPLWYLVHIYGVCCIISDSWCIISDSWCIISDSWPTV